MCVKRSFRILGSPFRIHKNKCPWYHKIQSTHSPNPQRSISTPVPVMNRRKIASFAFFSEVFLSFPEKGRDMFSGRPIFFGRSCMQGGACMQQKGASTNKTLNISKILSPAASDKVKGRCGHTDLYLWHRVSIIAFGIIVCTCLLLQYSSFKFWKNINFDTAKIAIPPFYPPQRRIRARPSCCNRVLSVESF